MEDSVDTPAPVMTSRRSEAAMKSASARISVAVAGGQSGAVDGRRLPHPAEVAEATAADSLLDDVDVDAEDEGPAAAERRRRKCVKRRFGGNDDDNVDIIVAPSKVKMRP